MIHHKAAVFLTLTFALVATGCDDHAVEPPDQTTREQALVRSVTGELVSKAEMEVRTKEVARAVALALAVFAIT